MTEDKTEQKGELTFNPPLYTQRYVAVRDFMYKIAGIEKVVDFGCSEGKFIKYLKNLPFVTEISCIDIHNDSLQSASRLARPLAWDYTFKRYRDLHLKIYNGSVLEKDARLLGYNAVTCIELIEHLDFKDHNLLISNVFDFIRPKIAIFTTPNREFNVLFPQVKEFRHWDHRFEWTRDEFKEWCESIVKKYNNYYYEIEGIGDPPTEFSSLGSCSQMAIFQQKLSVVKTTDFVFTKEPYKLIEDYLYPGRNENISSKSSTEELKI